LLFGVAFFGSVKQYRKRLILQPQGIFAEAFGLGIVPWDTIKMAVILPLGRLPFLHIVRTGDASTLRIPAWGFAVVPDTVGDAINKRLTHFDSAASHGEGE
jgi:hypothetical protein